MALNLQIWVERLNQAGISQKLIDAYDFKISSHGMQSDISRIAAKTISWKQQAGILSGVYCPDYLLSCTIITIFFYAL